MFGLSASDVNRFKIECGHPELHSRNKYIKLFSVVGNYPTSKIDHLTSFARGIKAIDALFGSSKVANYLERSRFEEIADIGETVTLIADLPKRMFAFNDAVQSAHNVNYEKWEAAYDLIESLSAALHVIEKIPLIKDNNMIAVSVIVIDLAKIIVKDACKLQYANIVYAKSSNHQGIDNIALNSEVTRVKINLLAWAFDKLAIDRVIGSKNTSEGRRNHHIRELIKSSFDFAEYLQQSSLFSNSIVESTSFTASR